jgi:phosphoribosylglycinamide formyltransferase 1
MTKLAILGSTKGTDMQAIIDAIEAGRLDAKIEIVISNKPDAYILQRAKDHNITTAYVNMKDEKGVKKPREEFDKEIINILQKKQVDLVLLIGYMRIITKSFVDAFPNKIMNVHPSLLPKFAGGMDTNVHEEVLKAGETETGCTIHYVDETVDGGPIVIQKKCAIEPDETADTLKTKVQKLEGEAFIEAIRNYKTP